MTLPRLYAILDVETARARGLDPHAVVQAWLAAGVRLIQLRAKGLSLGASLAIAGPMADQCAAAGALFVVNDRADVARLCGADGVHVGQQDLTPGEARAVYPEARLIGHSTHDLAQLEASLAGDATYTAYGPVFPTVTKRGADPAVGLEGVRIAAAARRAPPPRPLVAIGGLTLASAPAVIEAGAEAVAVISDLIEGDVAARARAWLRALA